MLRRIEKLIKHLLVFILVLVSIGLAACAVEVRPDAEASQADKPDARAEMPAIEAIHKVPAMQESEPITVITATPAQSPNAPVSFVSRAVHAPAPELVPVFMPENMKTGVMPVAYLGNPCYYLENRWAEGKSNPGTVVVPIMFHSVVQPGRQITDDISISMEYFEYFMETAKDLGFSTITAEDLVGFLEDNRAIPERSMILILDDRRPGVTQLFMPYLEENDWTLTLGWITTDTTRIRVWETMTALASTGRLDVQSHGYNHTYIQPYFDVEDIEQELFKPIEVIQARFGTTPVAHVWAGGNFTDLAIAMAGEVGYKIGFTAFSRGPILYNWIPQGEPEMAMGAPLMLLPRFWATGAVQALEEAVAVSEAAKAYAESVQAAELTYYAYYCQPPGSE
jgi:peptidoglycan/xylan/chitin deacetylase (PgdA/CDA1 family)